MPDCLPCLAQLRRPGLLMRAARHGLAHYRRAGRIRRLLSGATGPDQAMHRLIAAEALLEETRRRGDASYSAATHIEVLVALLAEWRLRTRARPV